MPLFAPVFKTTTASVKAALQIFTESIFMRNKSERYPGVILREPPGDAEGDDALAAPRDGGGNGGGELLGAAAADGHDAPSPTSMRASKASPVTAMTGSRRRHHIPNLTDRPSVRLL